MKKFLMCIVVLVTLLFVGFTTYYFIRNDEDITYNVKAGSNIYMNVGDEINAPYTHLRKKTKVTVKSSNPEVITVNETDNSLKAISGGNATITITPENEDFDTDFYVYIAVGNGKADSPYNISTPSQLAKIGTNDNFGGWTLTDSYRLTADIDLSAYNNGVWKPIGSDLNMFAGNFDGYQHKIYNMNINASGGYVGLFSSVSSKGHVHNIEIEGATITGTPKAAGFVAGLNNGIIGLCNVKNSKAVITSDTNFGGIVGVNKYNDKRPQVNMCEAYIEVSGQGNVGGLVGQNAGGAIINCFSRIKNAKVASGYFGGLIGNNSHMDSKRSVIERSYTIIDGVNGSAEFAAIAGVSNFDNTVANSATYYDGLIYCTSVASITRSVAEGNENFIVNKNSVEELCDKSTYLKASSEWNFDGVWILTGSSDSSHVEPDTARIDYEGSYESLTVYDVGQEITNIDNLISAFVNMYSSPSEDITYKITKNLVLDMQDNAVIEKFNKILQPLGKSISQGEWLTIGSLTNPFMGSFIAEKGVTIQNANISSEYSGIFGVVGNVSTTISGLTVENLNITGSIRAGIIASNVGIIKDISVSGTTITAPCAGGVVGYNTGRIENVTVMGLDKVNNITYSGSQSALIGGITGYNEGTVKSSVVAYSNINISTSGDTRVGGIAGENSGIIDSVSTSLGSSFGGTSSALTYAGGLVGYQPKGKIIRSYNGKSQLNFSMDNANCFVGGVAGYLGSEAIIEKSFAKGIISGYNLGGIVAINNGTVSTSYAETMTLTGINAGGLSYKLTGNINNSYARVSFEGKGNGYLAGFTVYLEKGSTIEYCYNQCSFGGTAKEKQGETQSPFKAKAKNYGSIKHSVLVRQEGMDFDIQWKFNMYGLKKPSDINIGWQIISFGIFENPGDDYIECSTDEAQGIGSNFEAFKEKAGFNTGIWQFGNESYPYLQNMPSDEE